MILQDPHLDFDFTNSKNVTDTDDCSLSNEMLSTECIARRRGQSSYGSWGQEEGNVFTILSRARFVTNTFFTSLHSNTRDYTYTDDCQSLGQTHTLTNT